MIKQFFSWWGGELAGLLPESWRARSRRRGSVLRFHFSPEEVIANYHSDGGSRELGRIHRASEGEEGWDPAANSSVSAMIAGLRPERTRCEVSLPRNMVLTREITLPLAAEENLHDVLSFEMERQTPFRARDVYFDYDVLERDTAAQNLRIDLHVTRRRVVDEVLNLLETWDLRAVPNFAREVSGTANKVNMCFLSQRYQTRSSTRLNVFLGLLAVGLLVAAVVIPLREQRQYISELNDQVDAARASAATSSQLEEQVKAFRSQVVFLGARKTRYRAAVEMLEELSRLLPDSTWLFRMEVRDGKVDLRGTSEAASALIATLEESEFFEDVRFGSPTTKEGATGRERFHLTASVVARTQPVAQETEQES